MTKVFAKTSLKGELQEVSKGNSHIYALPTKALIIDSLVAG